MEEILSLTLLSTKCPVNAIYKSCFVLFCFFFSPCISYRTKVQLIQINNTYILFLAPAIDLLYQDVSELKGQKVKAQ